jgi:RNA polymerase sigma factor (sigma-70 family)
MQRKEKLLEDDPGVLRNGHYKVKRTRQFNHRSEDQVKNVERFESFRLVSVDPQIFAEILVDQSSLPDSHYLDFEDDQRKELFSELAQRIIQHLPVILTPKQFQLVDLYLFKNKTQVEIAEMLKIRQSTISKLLSGNISYSVKGVKLSTKKRYGGAFKRIRLWVARDSVCKELVRQINEIGTELELEEVE